MRSHIVLIVASLLIAVSGCQDQGGGAGPGRREQVLALRPSDELQIGRKAFREILSGAPRIQSGPEVEDVQRVSKRIATAALIEPLQREINLQLAEYQFEWEYAVVKDERVNAFCLPAGKIVVFTGLIKFVQNEDQLAAVISHEIAHALAHHISERIAREQTIRNGLLNLAFSREQELEADHIGVFLMTFAGYDPDQAVELWRDMLTSRGHGIGIPEILSDHPSDAHRLLKMQTWANDAKAAKVAYDQGRIANP